MKKGKSYEHQIRDLFRRYFKGYAIERMPRSGGFDNKQGDILFQDYLPFSVECKNQKRGSLGKFFEQAEGQAKYNELPILFLRRNNRSFGILRDEDLVSLLSDLYGGRHQPKKNLKDEKTDTTKGLPFSKTSQIGKSKSKKDKEYEKGLKKGYKMALDNVRKNLGF